MRRPWPARPRAARAGPGRCRAPRCRARKAVPIENVTQASCGAVYSSGRDERPDSGRCRLGLRALAGRRRLGARHPERRDRPGAREAGRPARCSCWCARRSRRCATSNTRCAAPTGSTWAAQTPSCTTRPQSGWSTTSISTKATPRWRRADCRGPRLAARRQVVRARYDEALAHVTGAPPAGRHRVLLEPGADRRAVRVPDRVRPVASSRSTRGSRGSACGR